MLVSRLKRRGGGRSCVSQERSEIVRAVGLGCDGGGVVMWVVVVRIASSYDAMPISFSSPVLIHSSSSGLDACPTLRVVGTT